MSTAKSTAKSIAPSTRAGPLAIIWIEYSLRRKTRGQQIRWKHPRSARHVLISELVGTHDWTQRPEDALDEPAKPTRSHPTPVCRIGMTSLWIRRKKSKRKSLTGTHRPLRGIAVQESAFSLRATTVRKIFSSPTSCSVLGRFVHRRCLGPGTIGKSLRASRDVMTPLLWQRSKQGAVDNSVTVQDHFPARSRVKTSAGAPRETSHESGFTENSGRGESPRKPARRADFANSVA